MILGDPGSKEFACNVGDLCLIRGSERFPAEGDSTLVGYSTWGCKESDMTERLTLNQNINMKSKK